MIKGDVMFFASAITNGEIVDGIKDLGDKFEVSQKMGTVNLTQSLAGIDGNTLIVKNKVESSHL